MIWTTPAGSLSHVAMTLTMVGGIRDGPTPTIAAVGAAHAPTVATIVATCREAWLHHCTGSWINQMENGDKKMGIPLTCRIMQNYAELCRINPLV